ncbi:phospholipase D-like domain-containing protein [Mycobacterium sp.]|uniref:phospholipase D-like domain-containing protein n=1 Tax=Mycobacterium sp. TaxID=1785 RepID=UPI003D09F6B2
MSVVRANNTVVEVSAYGGDAKTLLAFDLVADSARTGLAGFTIQVHPPGSDFYFVDNNLRLAESSAHAQVAGETPFSSVNAPIHKFRWVHVPGLVHQGGTPAFGTYTYAVTPRYFTAAGALQALDPSTSVSVNIDVGPFAKGALRLAFTRGYVQSQSFVRHFGPTAHIRPAGDDLLFDTSATAATNAAGQSSTYAQEYDWLGFTARQRVFEILHEVAADPSLTLDVFAYDLNEPDVCALLLELGKANRVRIILDDAALHHDTAKPTPEDQFEATFKAQPGGDSAIKRGHFGRYAHDKVLVVSDQNGPRSVLTGSTNFSVTGLYVNANHVLVFDDRQVAATYANVFTEAWNTDVKAAPFAASQWAAAPFTFGGNDQGVPSTSITFSPHSAPVAQTILTGLVDRITSEGATTSTPVGTVFFAVMELNGTSANPVYTALNAVHSDPNTFSLGISDAPGGVSLYPVGAKTGVLVTGKPGTTVLPPPFDQVPTIAGHEIHHKFVVCGFNGDDPVVYCGSSNLALGGEQANGDNLLAIHDADVATAFTIEALLLVDHYNFLDSVGKNAQTNGAPASPPQANRQEAAVAAGWFLGTTDQWTDKYFDPNDLHYMDRRLFGDGPAVPAATTPGAGRSGDA